MPGFKQIHMLSNPPRGPRKVIAKIYSDKELLAKVTKNARIP